MPDQEQKVCDACHEQPATFHSTMFIGDSAQTRDLCPTCWERLASPQELASQQRFQELIRNGKCKYCGQQAAGGSISGGWPGEEHVNLYCELCQRDYAEFTSRPENKLPDDFPEHDDAAMEEMSARLSRLKAAAEDYVRQRVAERRSGR
jgi:hypothetical protein